MATVYAVDVNVNLLNGGGGGGGGGGGSAIDPQTLENADRLVAGIATSYWNVDKAAQSVSRQMGVWGQLFAARELEKFGRAGVDAFEGIMGKAGNLEEVMLNVRTGFDLTSGATDALVEKLKLLDQAHDTTAMNMARSLLIMQQSGISNPADALKLLEPGNGKGGLAAFHDLMLGRADKVDSDQSTKFAMQLFNTLSITDPSKQADALDLFARALKFDPQSSPGGLLGSLQNIHRTAAAAHMPVEQQMQLAAMTTMGGQSGREAQQIANLIGTMELIGHGTKKQQRHQAAELEKAGRLDKSGDPTSDIFGMLQKISRLEGSDQTAYKNLVASAFPEKRQQQEILELTQPAKLAQMESIRQRWADIKSMVDQVAIIHVGMNHNLRVLDSNIEDIKTTAGTGLLGATKGLVDILNNWTGDIKKWQQTPEGKLMSAGRAAAAGAGGFALEKGSQAAMLIIMARMMGIGAGTIAAGASMGGLALGVGGLGYLAKKAGMDPMQAATSLGPLGPLISAIMVLTDVFRKYSDGTPAQAIGKSDVSDFIHSERISREVQRHIEGTLVAPKHALGHLLHDVQRGSSQGSEGGSGGTFNRHAKVGGRGQ